MDKSAESFLSALTSHMLHSSDQHKQFNSLLQANLFKVYDSELIISAQANQLSQFNDMNYSDDCILAIAVTPCDVLFGMVYKQIKEEQYSSLKILFKPVKIKTLPFGSNSFFKIADQWVQQEHSAESKEYAACMMHIAQHLISSNSLENTVSLSEDKQTKLIGRLSAQWKNSNSEKA